MNKTNLPKILGKSQNQISLNLDWGFLDYDTDHTSVSEEHTASIFSREIPQNRGNRLLLTTVTTYDSTWCHKLQNDTHNSYCCQNLRYYPTPSQANK